MSQLEENYGESARLIGDKYLNPPTDAHSAKWRNGYGGYEDQGDGSYAEVFVTPVDFSLVGEVMDARTPLLSTEERWKVVID
jgi:hypothetical protein